ncbi:MAG: hypothetical protein AAFZ63_28495 [Bacteroidota bacterium]
MDNAPSNYMSYYQSYYQLYYWNHYPSTAKSSLLDRDDGDS